MYSIYNQHDDLVEIEGVAYEINVSFDNILNIIDLLNESKLPDHRKLDIAIKLLFGRELPFDTETKNVIFNQVFEEYINQEQVDDTEYDLQGNPMPKYEKDRKNYYSLVHDAKYIYAAFRQSYGINLFKEHGKLHWFDFQALLASLPDNTRFRQIINIRMWKKPTKNDTEAKRMYELQKIYALPDEVGEDDE